MGRRIDVDQLVGTAEIAKRLGAKSPEIVLTWMRRYTAETATDERPAFPAPIARLQMGLVFNWPDVERWAKHTGRIKR